MKIKLYNDFHDTEVSLISKGNRLTGNQMKRSRRVLCGIKNCTCGDDFGMRGPQDYHVILDANPVAIDPAMTIASVKPITDHKGG